MSDFKSNVEKILQAEKERASLISKAKDRKHNTIRKARIDAEETLSEYSDALSSEVKVKEDSVQEACRNEERDILESSKKEIEETQTAEETLSEYSDALSSEVKVKEDSVQEACRNEERDILESSKKEIEETQTVSQSKKNEIVDILARYVLPN
ncbi:GatB/Yqey family protein [Perkinsela sp. CCAP 1560/4]|nr:GatB/Yqey family protein [Perkinsela sp. CCAP 1560/4]|eukprot:KNH06086.1 GatB/Yqey family protein [Perkinsela sp. CCAP 1560/4]